MSPRLLAYARVSSLEQAQGTSLQDQQNAIAAYAKARGLKVARFYVEAESGIREKIESRAQMQELLSDVRRGDEVLCDKIDRWSRDTEWTLRSVRELREKGVRWYAVGDSCDPATHDGELMLTMRAMFAREEHKRIKLRTVGTRRLLRDQGYYVEGLPPFGYRRPDVKGLGRNVLAIEPKEAELIQRVFRLSIAGRSISESMAITSLGKDRIKDMLACRLYTGEIQNSHKEWIVGKHPAIVDSTTYARARQAVEQRQLGGPRPRGTASRTDGWILRDVAACALCGARMSSSYGHTQVYYRCSHRCTSAYVPVVAVEREAATLIFDRLLGLRDELGESPRVERPRIDTASKLKAIASRRERLIDSFERGVLTAEDIATRLQRLDAERQKLLASQPRNVDPKVRRDALKAVNALAHAWENMPAVERRATVNDLTMRAEMAANQALHMVWRDASDLASEE